MKKFRVHNNVILICGDTVKEAVSGREMELVSPIASTFGEIVIKVLDTQVTYSPSILGGNGGTLVTVDCIAANFYVNTSPLYKEFFSSYPIWVYTDKDGNPY